MFPFKVSFAQNDNEHKTISMLEPVKELYPPHIFNEIKFLDHKMQITEKNSKKLDMDERKSFFTDLLNKEYKKFGFSLNNSHLKGQNIAYFYYKCKRANVTMKKDPKLDQKTVFYFDTNGVIQNCKYGDLKICTCKRTLSIFYDCFNSVSKNVTTKNLYCTSLDDQYLVSKYETCFLFKDKVLKTRKFWFKRDRPLKFEKNFYSDLSENEENFLGEDLEFEEVVEDNDSNKDDDVEENDDFEEDNEGSFEEEEMVHDSSDKLGQIEIKYDDESATTSKQTIKKTTNQQKSYEK